MQATSSIASEPKIDAFQMIHAEFKAILMNEKCRTCSCFHADVLNIILEKIRAFRSDTPDFRLEAIEKDFDHWVKEADFLQMHG
jgi:hypothetical protein